MDHKRDPILEYAQIVVKLQCKWSNTLTFYSKKKKVKKYFKKINCIPHFLKTTLFFCTCYKYCNTHPLAQKSLFLSGFFPTNILGKFFPNHGILSKTIRKIYIKKLTWAEVASCNIWVCCWCINIKLVLSLTLKFANNSHGGCFIMYFTRAQAMHSCEIAEPGVGSSIWYCQTLESKEVLTCSSVSNARLPEINLPPF